MNETFHIMGEKILGQHGEPPPGQCRNRVIQAGRAIPARNQKAQKHSQRRNKVRRLRLARLRDLLLQELAQSCGCKSTGVGSKILQ